MQPSWCFLLYCAGQHALSKFPAICPNSWWGSSPKWGHSAAPILPAELRLWAAGLQGRLEKLQEELSRAEAALEALLEGIKGEVEGYHKQLSQVGDWGLIILNSRSCHGSQGRRLPQAAEPGGVGADCYQKQQPSGSQPGGGPLYKLPGQHTPAH